MTSKEHLLMGILLFMGSTFLISDAAGLDEGVDISVDCSSGIFDCATSIGGTILEFVSLNSGIEALDTAYSILAIISVLIGASILNPFGGG